jgi:hypothetical protein
MSLVVDLIATSKNFLKIGIAGVRLKNSSGNLIIRNTGDSSDAEVTASKVNISGDNFVINSDSVGSGADFKVTLARPASGMTADVSLTLPVDAGTSGQVLATNGSGATSWVSAAGTTQCDKLIDTSLAFGSASPLPIMTTGVADIIDKIQVCVDTAFNGIAPVVSLGISGAASKYSATSDVDLKTVGVYEIHPGLPAAGVESLIATYVADASTVGAARIIIFYATPA